MEAQKMNSAVVFGAACLEAALASSTTRKVAQKFKV